MHITLYIYINKPYGLIYILHVMILQILQLIHHWVLKKKKIITKQYIFKC